MWEITNHKREEYLIIEGGGRLNCFYNTIIIRTMRPPEILKQIAELREIWRKQFFSFTTEQKTKYDELMKLRRERVKYFYDNDLVYKGSKQSSTKTTPNP